MSRGFDSIRRRLRPLALLALVLVASCGGGDRVSNFRAGRLFVFGDEHNVIVGSSGTVTDVSDGSTVTAPAGAKYTVNAFALDAAGQPTSALACTSNLLWHQVVAGFYGIGYAECSAFTGPPAGFIYAQVGARVANVATQVATATAAAPSGRGPFGPTDLVMIMVGQRDIIETYRQYPATLSADAAVAQAETFGRALGAQVNAIANLGAKVLVTTVPNQGSTPYAVAQNTDTSDPSRSGLLQRMTERFNAGMRATIINDGTKIGLVQADEQVQLVVNNPSAFAIGNVSSAVCTVALPNCTTATLAVGATATGANYVWADDRHPNADINVRIGNLAVQRAANNSF